jgi:Transglutaminase-like superfamily
MTPSWIGDLGRVLVALPFVEFGRVTFGPSRILPRLRRSAERCRRRPPPERGTLRRVIAAVDARLPGGGNCYRRALLEIVIDAGAAEEKLYMGLKTHGGPRSGHAWLASWPDAANAAAYDVVLEM